jgi:hypothetical protein
MMRNRYPHTSNPEILEAQLGAAMAKSLAGIAIVGIIVGLGSLSARDALRIDSPRVGETVVAQAGASVVESTAPAAADPASSPVASNEQLDAVDDYRATADYSRSPAASDGPHEPVQRELDAIDDYRATADYSRE